MAIAGAAFTLAALAALGAGGYLLALRLLGAERARDEPLDLAVATLLAATGLGVAVTIALGACGELRWPLALLLQAALCLLLLLGSGGRPADGRLAPARALLARSWAQAAAHPALSLLTLHAIGSEALRGLLRPPLSWDSLMYHLLLTATWLQRHDLAPVFGIYPLAYYGYAPANGSLWLWWWMAPSHGELYANLAFLPQWALLALASGAVARRLGARRSWPLAAFLVAATPTVLRFAATQYVDIFTAACLVAACYFGLRWVREPRGGDAALAGIGLGLAAGAKVLGLVYAGTLALSLLALARGEWRRRLGQLAAALAVTAALGSFFYLRNVGRGVDPLALECEGLPHKQPGRELPRLPRPYSVAALPHEMLAQGRLLRALLGTAERGEVFSDLGLGPQAFLVLLAIPALGAVARERRREAAVVGSQIVAEAALWAMIPYAVAGHVFANIRYLLAAVGLALAGGVAAAESRGAPAGWLGAAAVALLAQDLLQLHTTMPDGVRIAVGVLDVAAVALALSPRLRQAARRHWRPLLAGACALTLCGAPLLARFRVADRTRALTQEYTAHGISTYRYARAWDWLDHHGDGGTVAVVSSPETVFIYPAMGAHLERRALYVNVNRRDLREAAAYPLCQPRVEPDAAAWVANLERAGVRWIHLGRAQPYPFPMESGWARASARFALRYQDPGNEIWELLPSRPGSAPPPAPGPGGPEGSAS